MGEAEAPALGPQAGGVGAWPLPVPILPHHPLVQPHSRPPSLPLTAFPQLWFLNERKKKGIWERELGKGCPSLLPMLSSSCSMNESDVGLGWRKAGGEKPWEGQPGMELPWEQQPVRSSAFKAEVRVL